jgi:hypothetical protein
MADILPGIIFTLIVTLIYLVPAVAVIALIMWLLRRMVKRGKISTGAILLIGVCILITGASFLFVKTTSTSVGGVSTWVVYVEEKGVTGADIEIAQDRKTKEIYGFGPLIISDKKGNRYIPLTFDDKGTLIGSSEAMAYAKPIHEAVGDLPGTGFLTGNSLSELELQSIIDTKMTKHNEIFSWEAVRITIMQWNTVTLFLVIYFVVQILQNRKRDRINSRYTEINDL